MNTPVLKRLLLASPICNTTGRLRSNLSWNENFPKYMTYIFGNTRIPRLLGDTADEVTKDLNLEGKRSLITGANSGIGLEMARCLSARGSEVVMACRNTYAANLAAKQIAMQGVTPSVLEMNLASLKSVKKCSDELVASDKKIDILILNAAVFGLPWTLTENGIETQCQVNFLSQYYLLMNIEKLLTPDARVVFVSSESHRNVKWNIHQQLAPKTDMISLPKNEYTSIKAYNIAKLCGILAMHYLGYRWMNTGKKVLAANPGSFVRTGLSRNWWVYETLYSAMQPFSKSVSQAAATPLYCATSPDIEGTALYYHNCMHHHESDLAKDFHLAFRIHDLSLDVINDCVRNLEKDLKAPVHEKMQEKPLAEEPLVSEYS